MITFWHVGWTYGALVERLCCYQILPPPAVCMSKFIYDTRISSASATAMLLACLACLQYVPSGRTATLLADLAHRPAVGCGLASMIVTDQA